MLSDQQNLSPLHLFKLEDVRSNKGNKFNNFAANFTKIITQIMLMTTMTIKLGTFKNEMYKVSETGTGRV